MPSPPIHNKDDFCGEVITRDPAIVQKQCLILPQNPFNGQIFIDACRVQWQFDEKLDVWCRIGKIFEVPLATSESPGLLDNADKIILDSIPPVGGAFGFIAQPFILKSPENPDGVMEGSLSLCSESLDMVCVDSQGQVIPEGCSVSQADDTELRPGVEFKLSDKFLDTLCFEAFGPQGSTGDQGIAGDKGDDGFKDSPQGEQGTPGVDATAAATLVDIRIEELDEIRDTAVVAVELDQLDGVLSYVSAKMNVAESDEPADQLIVTPTLRTLFYPLLADDPVEYTTLDDWRVAVPPGDPNQDPELLLFKIPESTQMGDEVDLIPIKLTTFIQAVVEFYKVCLTDFETMWLQEVCEFINEKDAQARTILATMAQKVAECEFQRPLQFCLGIEPGECPETLTRNINIIQEAGKQIDPLEVVADVNIVPSQPPP